MVPVVPVLITGVSPTSRGGSIGSESIGAVVLVVGRDVEVVVDKETHGL